MTSSAQSTQALDGRICKPPRFCKLLRDAIYQMATNDIILHARNPKSTMSEIIRQNKAKLIIANVKKLKKHIKEKKVLQVLGLPYLQRQFPTHTSITQSRNPRQNPLSQGMCDETGTVCIIEDPMHAMSPPVCTKIETSEESQHQYATLLFFFGGGQPLSLRARKPMGRPS